MKEERLKISGRIEIFDKKTKRLLYSKKNLIVDNGLSLVMDRLKNNNESFLSHIAVGIDDTPVSIEDTSLGDEIFRKEVSSVTAGVGTLEVVATIEASEAINNWYECGIFNDSSGGTMFNRINIDFDKTGIDAVEIKFTILLVRG